MLGNTESVTEIFYEFVPSKSLWSLQCAKWEAKEIHYKEKWFKLFNNIKK